MKITAYTYVGDYGQAVRAFDIACEREQAEKINPSDFAVANAYRHFIGSSVQTTTVDAVEPVEGGIRVSVPDFLWESNFTVTASGSASGLSFGKADVTEVRTEIADEFEALREGGVHYRLYAPPCTDPRPLILFLHGGGHSGYDNWRQMVTTYGAAALAERYPDMYVMAPQAIPNKGGKGFRHDPRPDTDEPAAELIEPNTRSFQFPAYFASKDWSCPYLAQICAVIRRMITEGRVDGRRVYVTGLSMGGAGTIRALKVGKGLFAAAVPIAPMMNDEIYYDLRFAGNQKVWVCAAYLDHVFDRNQWIADAILYLRRQGNLDARFTMFSREEIERYQIGTDPGTTLVKKLQQNHCAAFVLTYHNEHGIMDWMTSQIKD